MAKFGEHVKYNGLIYKVVAVSEDATPTYTLEPVRRETKEITKTITTGRTQNFLIPSGGSNLTSIAGDDISVVGQGTAIAKSLAKGIVRISFDSNEGSDVAYQDIDSGDGVTEPDDPTKEGFVFDAWYHDNTTFADAVDFASDVFTDEATLYAKWTEEEA